MGTVLALSLFLRLFLVMVNKDLNAKSSSSSSEGIISFCLHENRQKGYIHRNECEKLSEDNIIHNWEASMECGTIQKKKKAWSLAQLSQKVEH